jgi:UDP-glucose 4-epimerase
LHVLEAARQAGVRRVVYAASSSAYGDQEGDCRTEKDQLLPLSPYAAAKLAGEHYAACFTASYGLETVRLRFFNVFGPRQDPKSPYSGVIALFIDAMTKSRPPTIFGDGLQSRDFVYVDNVVDALIQAAESKVAAGNVYNIGTGTSTNLLELVAALNQILGSRLQPLHGPPRSGDVRFSRADIARARQDLAYEPKISFLEGLRRTVAAYHA